MVNIRVAVAVSGSALGSIHGRRRARFCSKSWKSASASSGWSVRNGRLSHIHSGYFRFFTDQGIQIPENNQRKKNKQKLIIAFLDFLNCLTKWNGLITISGKINKFSEFRAHIIEQEQQPNSPINDR